MRWWIGSSIAGDRLQAANSTHDALIALVVVNSAEVHKGEIKNFVTSFGLVRQASIQEAHIKVQVCWFIAPEVPADAMLLASEVVSRV